MTKHLWRKYDIERAQIRDFEFYEENGAVMVALDVIEEWLREKGYEPKEEFDAKMEKLLKAVMESK